MVLKTFCFYNNPSLYLILNRGSKYNIFLSFQPFNFQYSYFNREHLTTCWVFHINYTSCQSRSLNKQGLTRDKLMIISLTVMPMGNLFPVCQMRGGLLYSSSLKKRLMSIKFQLKCKNMFKLEKSKEKSKLKMESRR